MFNLGNPGAVYKSLQSPLKFQTRCISAFPDKSGYLVGSVEGRVAVHHVEDALQSKNFTFKCHRWVEAGGWVWKVWAGWQAGGRTGCAPACVRKVLGSGQR